MLKLLVVGLGGFVGAIARYGISGWVHRRVEGPFPTGTLAVNVVGCLLIGMLMHLVEDRQFLAPTTRLFLMVGILGALTTFSTFGYETVQLLRDGETHLALASVAANVILGIGGVLAGRALVQTVGA